MAAFLFVGVPRFERGTSSMSTKRSNQLSYTPIPAVLCGRGRNRTFDLCLIGTRRGVKQENILRDSTALCGRGRNRTFDLCLIRTAFYH